MIHATLKQRCRDLHASVETKLRFLVSDELSLDQYVAVQKKLFGFYQPIEARLALLSEWGDPELKLSQRRKIPLLLGDLASLGIDTDNLAGVPLCENLPRLERISEGLGCLYVLEGSTLGGRIITQHLKKVLAVDERHGCSFFNSYGADVGCMWSSFLGILTRHCEKHGDADVVVDSACQTFASLERWLSQSA